MNDFNSFMDVICLLCFGYMAYQWYCFKIKREIKTGMVLSKDVPVNKCKDKEAYIDEVSGYILLMAVIFLAETVVFMVNNYITPLPDAVVIGVIVLFIAVLIWFGIKTKQIYEKYW